MHTVRLGMRALRRMLAAAALLALPVTAYGCASGGDGGGATDDGGGLGPDGASGPDAKPDHTVSEGGTADVGTRDTSSGGDTGPVPANDASDDGGSDAEDGAGEGGTSDATVDAAGVDSGGADAGVDAHAEAGPDAGVDAGHDAGVDAAADTGVDSGPPDTGAPDAGVDAPVLPACAAAYAMGDCTSYAMGTIVSNNGHNWLCSNGNCANCGVPTSMCAPGESGCAWGVVWTDEGACH